MEGRQVKGYTLIELVVSMALFSVLTTLVIGGFLSVGNMKGRSAAMKETQQRLRVAIEMINRTVKEADSVKLTSNNDLILEFLGKPGSQDSAIRFQLAGDKLLYSQKCFYPEEGGCPYNPASPGAWPAGVDLLGGTDDTQLGQVELDSANSLFAWNSPTLDGTSGMPPSLRIKLTGNVSLTGRSFFSDTFSIDDSIILENVK